MVVGKAEIVLNVEGAAKTPGTVTVRVTKSVDVDVRFDTSDVLIDVDILVTVKVANVVGNEPREVIDIELDVIDELDEVVELDVLLELVVVDETVVNGTVTKTSGADVVDVVVLVVVVVVVVVLETELVDAAISVTVTVTTDRLAEAEVDEAVVVTFKNETEVAPVTEETAAVAVADERAVDWVTFDAPLINGGPGMV